MLDAWFKSISDANICYDIGFIACTGGDWRRHATPMTSLFVQCSLSSSFPLATLGLHFFLFLYLISKPVSFQTFQADITHERL